VVGIVVDNDVVSVPEPIAAVTGVKWCDPEVVSTEPEAIGTSADDAPDVAATETTLKVAVFPGVVEVETGVIPSHVVADPFAVAVDVRSLRMIFTVPKRVLVLVSVVVAFVAVAMISRGPVARNVTSADVVVAVVAVVVVFLGESGQGEDQSRSKGSGE